MNKIKRYGLFLLVILIIPGYANSHTVWKPGSITPPRSSDLISNLNAAPCGGTSTTALPRGTKPRIFKPGEEITIEWLESFNHGGLFIIDYLDEAYSPLVPSNEIQIADSFINSIANDGMQSYSRLITIPNVECPKCVLRIIQEAWIQDFQSNKPAQQYDPVTNDMYWTNYYSCSDIRIESTSSIAPGDVSNETRIINPDNIVLNWINPSDDATNPKNAAYRVIILSDLNPVASLTDGTAYTVGDTVGTATVRYDGYLETTTISNLSNTDFLHFKIFTYDVSNNYSAGIDIVAAIIPVAPNVDLSLSQGTASTTIMEFNRSNGKITVTASVTNGIAGDNFTYDWSRTDNVIMSQEDTNAPDNKNSGIFIFDPTLLDPGIYNIIVSATNTVATNGKTSSDTTTTISIVIPSQTSNSSPESGGCSLSVNSKFDPLLMILFLISIFVVGFNARREN